MNITVSCLNLIKQFTILNYRAFRNESGWVIGYDHTDLYGDSVWPGQEVTDEEANRLLDADMRKIEVWVNDAVLVKLEQHQFDAICSYVKSVGKEAFLKGDLLRKLNARHRRVALEIMKDVHPNDDEHDAMVRRRQAEMRLFIGEAP